MEVVALIAVVGDEMTDEVGEEDMVAETTGMVEAEVSEEDLEEDAVVGEMTEGEEVEDTEGVEMIGGVVAVATEVVETLETAGEEDLAPGDP